MCELTEAFTSSLMLKTQPNCCAHVFKLALDVRLNTVATNVVLTEDLLSVFYGSFWRFAFGSQPMLGLLISNASHLWSIQTPLLLTNKHNSTGSQS